MQKKITIYDIAKTLGVSPSTVSRVVNNSSHPVKPEVRERVLEMIKTMGYVPNIQARNLKNRTSNTIGVVLPSISNPFYPSIVRGMEDETVRNHYTIRFASCDLDETHTERLIQEMIESNVRGIVTLFIEKQPSNIELYVQSGGKVVSLVEKDSILPNVHNIAVDKKREAGMATQHLLNLGHKKIAYLSDVINDSCIRLRRKEGFIETVERYEGASWITYENGKDIPLFTWSSVDLGYELTCEMLRRTPEVTAIVSMNDRMSLGAIKALREKGYTIPGDYSIVSFDDLFFAEYTEPPLTTMRVEKYRWGQELARYLISLIEEETSGEFSVIAEEEVIPTAALVVRGSTAEPRV